MPKRRRSTKKFSRNGKRRRRSRRRRRTVPRGLFSKRVKMRHKYVTTLALNPGSSGSVAYHKFSANGMYDPDITGTGHQPMGFDQYASFYAHYTVIASKITCVFVSEASGNTGSTLVSLSLAPGTATPLDATDLMEGPHTRFSVLTGSNASSKKTLSLGFSAKKFFSQNPMSEDNNAGTNGANPAEQAQFHIGVSNMLLGIDPTTVRVLVYLSYIAVWHEPKNVTGS